MMTSEERGRDHMRGVGAGIWANSEERKAERYLRVHTPGGSLDALVRLLDQHAEEQREVCADAVTYAWNHRNFDTSSYELMLRDACLGATVKGID